MSLQTAEERYASYPNVRTVTIKKVGLLSNKQLFINSQSKHEQAEKIDTELEKYKLYFLLIHEIHWLILFYIFIHI